MGGASSKPTDRGPVVKDEEEEEEEDDPRVGEGVRPNEEDADRDRLDMTNLSLGKEIWGKKCGRNVTRLPVRSLQEKKQECDASGPLYIGLMGLKT